MTALPTDTPEARPDDRPLRGRVCLVAGATRGAGRGIAVALGEAGAIVDGSRPDAWRYLLEVQDAGKPPDVTGYR